MAGKAAAGSDETGVRKRRVEMAWTKSLCGGPQEGDARSSKKMGMHLSVNESSASDHLPRSSVALKLSGFSFPPLHFLFAFRGVSGAFFCALSENMGSLAVERGVGGGRGPCTGTLAEILISIAKSLDQVDNPIRQGALVLHSLNTPGLDMETVDLARPLFCIGKCSIRTAQEI